MRHRVEVADRPDPLYALWDGRIFQANPSADGSVLLVVPEGEEAPEGFDTTFDDRPAKAVPAQEASAGLATFAVHTYCLYDDEPYRIEPSSDEAELTLRWTGTDERLAAELGLVDFSTTTDDPESLTALWQERHDFADENMPRSEPGSGDAQVLLRAIGRTLRGFLPSGWQRVAAVPAGGDTRNSRSGRWRRRRRGTVGAPASRQLFTQLRSAMYPPRRAPGSRARSPSTPRPISTSTTTPSTNRRGELAPRAA